MNLQKNIGEKERAVRILVGLSILVATAGGYISGGGGVAAALAAVVLVTTGLLNYCPLYKALGWSNMDACPTDKSQSSDKKE